MPQIGITVPGTVPDATPATPIEFAQRADAANLHSVWVTDRVMFKTPDPFVSLGALAAVTSVGSSSWAGSVPTRWAAWVAGEPTIHSCSIGSSFCSVMVTGWPACTTSVSGTNRE